MIEKVVSEDWHFIDTRGRGGEEEGIHLLTGVISSPAFKHEMVKLDVKMRPLPRSYSKFRVLLKGSFTLTVL